MKKAIIIIPTYNESLVIQSTIKSIFFACASVRDYQIEILVFDSHSTDDTVLKVKALQTDNPLLHLATEPQKSGLGSAYMQAMAYALNVLHADCVFEFDADGSHKPEYIPLMLEKIDAGADVVVGSRYVKGGSIPKDWAWHRKFLSVMGNLVSRVFLSHKHKDWTSGFRVTRAEILKKIPYTKLWSTGYAYKIHLFWLLHQAHAKIVEYPIVFVDREQGYSKLPKNNILESLRLVLRLRLQKMRYFIKMIFVGAFGMLLQLLVFNILRHSLLPQYANSIAVEVAVISNFLLNNVYTFRDRGLSRREHGVQKLFYKALHFNMISLVSLLIQFVVMTIGVDLFGRGLFVENLFLLIGAGLASINNYFTYSRWIWRKQ